MDSAAKLRARRPKPQLSCLPCRTKKQKCDRGRPCGNCLKTSAATKCVYAGTSGTSVAGLNQISGLRNSSSTRIRDRLQELESRIAHLSQGASSPPAEYLNGAVTGLAIEQDHVKDDAKVFSNNRPSEILSPRLSTTQQDQHFISSSHWEGLLDDLEGLKLELDPYIDWDRDEAESRTDDAVSAHPHLLFSMDSNESKEQLISSLPVRSVVGSLLDIFFRQQGLMPLISVMLHVPTFLQDLERFWADPRNVDLNWLSIVYSIMCLALQAELRTGRQVEGILLMDPTCEAYAKKAVLCLRSADYAKPTKYTVEAMTYSLACEQFWIEKEPYRASLVLSMIVRTALRMGYHRDPKHFPQMSIFDAEMQRRSWALILQMDLFLASKCGLPPLIDQSQSDTACPANLTDEDLSQDMPRLPSTRSEVEPTVIGYLNYKTRLATAHRRIFDRLNRSIKIEYDEIIRLDQDVSTRILTRPSWLNPPRNDESVQIQVEQIGPLIDADLIVHRARMALHHKFVVRARYDHQFIESRNIALESAKQALFYQGILADAPPSHPGGAKQTWRLLSLLTQDFLFAALVISLDLNYDLQEGNQALDATQAARVGEHLELLQRSHRIWKQCLDHSAGAQQAFDILGAMLERFSQAQCRNGSDRQDTDSQPKAFQKILAETTILRSQSSTAFPEPLMSPRNGLNPFARENMAAPYPETSTTAFDSFTFNDQVNFGGVDYDMVDTLLLGSEWPDLDFTTAVGML